MKREAQKKLQEIKERVCELEQHSPAKTKLLKDGVAALQRENVIRHPLKAWFVGMLAFTYHHRQDFAAEVELLKSYFAAPWTDPLKSYEFSLHAQLTELLESQRRFVPEVGTCEMCDDQNRRLTRIESGHCICNDCLTEFTSGSTYPRASRVKINELRRRGFDVNDEATILDVWNFKQILLRRRLGLRDDARYEELFNYLLAFGLSRGGQWESFDETYIAGGNHPNLDGTPRLKVLRQCRVGEPLRLVRDPENPHQEDMRAIKVCREAGEQLGYVPEHKLGNAQGIGPQLANWIDDGTLFRAQLTTISAKCKGGFFEFSLNHGDSIDEVFRSCEGQKDLRFDASTVTGRIEIFRFDGPWPESKLPDLMTLKDIGTLKRRIRKLQQQGINIGLEASFFDCWKQEQVLLRRSLGLQENVSHDTVVDSVYEQRLSRNGQWKVCSREYIALGYTWSTEASYVQLIERCHVGDRVILIRNPEDSTILYSVNVNRESGERIGAAHSSKVADQMDAGTPVDARIVDIHQPFPGSVGSLSICIEVRMFVLSEVSVP